MESRIFSASESVLRKAIRAAQPGGATYDYFTREGSWEASNRKRFAELISSKSFDTREFELESLSLLGRLNATYRTRHKRERLPDANRCLISAVIAFSHSSGMQTELVASTDAERNAMSTLVVNCMEAIRRTGSPRPYSLATKFLHFLMPNAFAIYDSQAAASITAWRRSTFGRDDRADFHSSRRFHYARMADTSGSGYRGVLDFYWLVWQS